MDGGAWWAAVHGVAKSRTRLSDFTFTFHFHALEKEMATHSSVLAWRIPGAAEPGGLLSMGSHRVGHDWSDLAAAASHQGSPRYVERALQKHYRCIRFFIWENWTFQFLREIRTKTEGKRITEIEKRSWLFFITSRNIRKWIKCEQQLWQVVFFSLDIQKNIVQLQRKNK